MKKIFRKNQIVITALAIMIAIAGYLNYAGKDDLNASTNVDGAGQAGFEVGMMDISDEDIWAENNAAAGGQVTIPEGNELEAADNLTDTPTDSTEIASLDLDLENASASIDNPGEAVLTSGLTVSDYIANVQMSREQVRAKNKETLMEIVNNTNIAEAQKQQALDSMVKLTEIAEKENAAETLLMAKGFADPVVSITDGKVDVVINAASITDPQRAQIEDIVKRKAEVSAENIIITLLSLSE